MRGVVAGGIGAFGSVLVVALNAQIPPRALPDIAGLRPGIPLEDAYRLLKAYNPKATTKLGQVQIPETGTKPIPARVLFKSPAVPGMKVPDIIQLELTLPPEKPVVWGILRRLSFGAGKERNRTSLLAELRQQYGQEGQGFTVPIVNIQWLFDEPGRRAEAGAAAAGTCALPGPWDVSLDTIGEGATSSTFPASSALLGRPASNQGPCKPLVYVKALFQPAAGFELIESTTVAVINGALAARAQAATAAYRADAAKRREK